MCIIYKITNLINEKSYIGFTSFSLDKRWKEHINMCKLGSSFYIYNAMRKYGIENFKIEVIEEHEDFDYCLKVLEPKYIIEHNTLSPNGYNLTEGGEGAKGYKHTDENKKIMSDIVIERCKNSEYLKMISENTKIQWKNEEFRINMSKNCSKRMKKLWKDPNFKKMQSKKFKETWKKETLKKFRSELTKKMWEDENHRLYITESMKNTWKDPEYRRNNIEKNCPNQYEVIFPDGHIEIIKSITEFSKKYNLCSGNMYRVINGTRNYHKGFKAKKLEL